MIIGVNNMSLTIYDIKYATLKNSPYYFDRKTMKFFGQRMSDFKVITSLGGRVFIYAQTYFWDRNINRNVKSGYSIREFTGDDLIEIEVPKYIEMSSKDIVKNWLKNVY